MNRELENIKARMIEAGIPEKEVNALVEPLAKELERRVCGLVWKHEGATTKLVEDMEGKLPVLTPVKDKNIVQDKTGINHILIEGENLLTLMAMQYTHIDENRKGLVDVIYIDPPYNTGSVTFEYNDKFEKSEWLSMMNIRLRLARNLLSDDGVIFVQIDENFQAELKLLMNDIFGSDHFVNCVSVKMSEASGMKMGHAEKRLPKRHENLYIYRKNTEKLLKNIRVEKEKWDSEYRIYFDNITDAEISRLKEIRENENRTDDEIDEADILLSKVIARPIEEIYKEKNIAKMDTMEFNLHNSHRIVQIASLSGGAKQFADSKRESTDASFFSIVTANKKMYFIRNGYDLSLKKPRMMVLFADDYLTYNPCDFWEDIKTTGIDAEGGVTFKNGKKPLRLLERCLDLANNKKAIVLDFFAGSGTTMHAVMELNQEDGGHRQCILCTNNELGTDAKKKAKANKISSDMPEYEDYGVCHAVTYPRLRNVFAEHKNDNLYYYQISDSIKESPIQKITRDALAKQAVSYIALKENILNVDEHKDYHILSNSDTEVLVVIDTDIDYTEVHDKIAPQVLSKANRKIYCSLKRRTIRDGIEYIPYPEEVLDVLKSVKKRVKEVPLETGEV